MPRKPNLFIIGAAKSGTTSLHDLLSAHPDIFLSEPKEPGFFVPELTYYPSDEAWYLSLFESAGEARYAGESSTHYTKLPIYAGVVDRIAAFVEERPHFIYLMRDPIERALSNYWHNVRKHQEHRSLETALRLVPEYLAVSDYPTQLRPYLEAFGRDRVFAATFERLVGRPTETVAEILEWLELGPIPAGTVLQKRNARPERFTRVRGRGLLHRLASSRFWGRLSPLAPRWPKEVAKSLGYGRVEADEVSLDTLVDALRPDMRRVVRDLESLLGRTFEEWTTTLTDRAPSARAGTGTPLD